MSTQEQFHKLEYADGVAVPVKVERVDTEELLTVKTVEVPITFHQEHNMESEFTAVSVKEEAVDTEELLSVKTVEIPITFHQEHNIESECPAVSVKEEAGDTDQLGAEWGPQYGIDIKEADVKGECAQVSSAGAGHSHTGHKKSKRTKWKNLRTHFYRELGKIEKPKSGDAAKDTRTTSSWQFLYQMMLLNDKVSVEQRYSNLTQFDDSGLNSRDKESQDEMIRLLSPILTSNSSAAEQVNRPKKKMKYMSTVAQRDEQMVELERRKVEILEKETAKDSDDDLLYFQSLLPYMKQIPLIRKLKLRSKIQDLILQQLDGIENKRPTHHTTQLPVIKF